MQKAITLNPKAMDVSTTYAMMTKNGAKALHFDGLGEIVEGGMADLIIVNMENDISVLNNATRLSNFLFAGTGHAVDAVFAGGVMTVKGGVYIHLDMQNIAEKCEKVLYDFNKKLQRHGFISE